MIKTRLTALLVALAVAALTPAPAALGAHPCQTNQPEAGVPIRIPTGPADLGMIGEACAATSVAMDARMSLTLATEEFYGGLVATATARARMQIGDIAWLSAVLPGYQYRLLANATVTATSSDLGPGSLGAHVVFLRGDWFQVTPHVRFLLPTETVYQHGTRLGVDLGVSALFHAHDQVEILAGAAFPMTSVYLGGKQLTTFVPNLAADVTWHPLPWLAVAAGLGVRLAPHGGDDAFESLDPRFGLRFYALDHLLIEVTAVAPVAGRDRTDAAAFLSLGWVFDEGPFRVSLR